MNRDIMDLAESAGNLDMLLELMNCQHFFALFRLMFMEKGENFPEFDLFKHEFGYPSEDARMLAGVVGGDKLTDRLFSDPKFLNGYKTAVATGLNYCRSLVLGRARRFVRNPELKEIDDDHKRRVLQIDERLDDYKRKVLQARSWEELDSLFDSFSREVVQPIESLLWKSLAHFNSEVRG